MGEKKKMNKLTMRDEKLLNQAALMLYPSYIVDSLKNLSPNPEKKAWEKAFSFLEAKSEMLKSKSDSIVFTDNEQRMKRRRIE